jgi:ABC-type antimicrobial peptide transport system permease subunit
VSIIDNTFASPVNFRPAEAGFDLSLHSCTKYLNGHTDIVAGAVIAESIFNFPGMGLLFWQSALAHDFPVMLGGTLIIGVATVVGNLAADVAYSSLDPRIRYGRA